MSLAKAVERSGVGLLGSSAMSDHTHTTLRDNQGKHDVFNEYFNGQLALAVNRYLGREHQLWARRARVEVVHGSNKEQERVVYALTNPQAADLVERGEQWPGFSSFEYYATGNKPRFVCFDRTRWHHNKRPKDIGPYLYTVTLEHAPLGTDCETGADPAAARERVMVAVREREAALIAKRRKAGKRVLGHAGLQRTVATDRAANPKKSSGPLCHSDCPHMRKAYAMGHREFERQACLATKLYMQGMLDVVFPPGAQVPGRYPRPRYPDDPDNAPVINLSTLNIARTVALQQAAA